MAATGPGLEGGDGFGEEEGVLVCISSRGEFAEDGSKEW